MSAFDRNVIRKFLQDKMSGNLSSSNGRFVFRRVSWVSCQSPMYTKYTLPNEEPERVSILAMNHKEIDKSVQIDCDSFFGGVEPRSIRDEPLNIRGKEIYFNSSSYRNFDITGLSFELERVKSVTPIEGDLLCLWLSQKSCEKIYNNYDKPTADAWFIASEQYLRAHTSIMSDNHDALYSLLPKNTGKEQREERLKQKLFSGNRLMTNTWLKTKLAYEQNGQSFPREESINAYWHLRCDYASKYWVDVLAALVLISRYGELPNSSNVPNTKGTGFQRDKWNLPEGFVRKLFTVCNCDFPEEKPVRHLPDAFELFVEWDVYQNSLKVQTQTMQNTNVETKVQVQKPNHSLDILMKVSWTDDSEDYLYELK